MHLMGNRRRSRVGKGVGQYSRMSFSSDQVTGTVFPHLTMPFLPNSEFISNIVPVGKR